MDGGEKKGGTKKSLKQSDKEWIETDVPIRRQLPSFKSSLGVFALLACVSVYYWVHYFTVNKVTDIPGYGATNQNS